MASPPTPLRMARGVVCEVTPIGPASPPTPLRMERGVICEVTPTVLLVWGVVRSFSHADEVFSHRTHRINRTFLRTVSNSQKASGIQRSQNVIAIVDMFKGLHEAFVLLIGVSR